VPATASVNPRIDSIDVLRGLVMVLMALDHTRDFFSNETSFDPLDLTRTYPALFLTRWVTHFCAPVFIFLAGTGALLSTGRGKTKKALSWFLLTRGVWCVVLELTVIRCLGWTFNFDYVIIPAGVFWAIGWSMIVLAGLVHLPPMAVAAFGVAMAGAHNAFDGVTAASWGSLGWLWTILHVGGPIDLGNGRELSIWYPLVPWIGVMAAGYGFGALIDREPARRRKAILITGVTLTLLFVVLRAINAYGDPRPWAPQGSGLYTLFAFVSCNKYPPSLLYLLMTLGPALIVLAMLDRGTPRWMRPILIFGRVPLFYYLLHIPLIHGLAVAVEYIRLGDVHWLFGLGLPRPAGAGFGLVGVYVVWAAVVVSLYPVCRWFAGLKRRRRDPWLSYL
jgi:uncharacterized membrane protein